MLPTGSLAILHFNDIADDDYDNKLTSSIINFA